MVDQAGVGRALFVVALLFCTWSSAAAGSEASGASTTPSDSQIDGRGLEYAQECQAELFEYRNESIEYYSLAPALTKFYTSTIIYTGASRAAPVPTSLTTLCDGYPRVVGNAQAGKDYSALSTYIYTNSDVVRQTSYTKPQPCTIGPQDCASLYSSWSKYTASLSVTGVVLDSPPCTTTNSFSQTYSTNSAGRACNNCQIVASTAKLLYWPVTTVAGSGDLCDQPISAVPDAPISTAPKVFVTDNVTITSPTVAILFSSLSRADGCGPIVPRTIIPVRPEEVSSIRGYRAYPQKYPFNAADLNWHCAEGEFTSEDDHHDCYQEVPADAYFDGTNKWVGLNALHINWRTNKNLTIFNDYQPQILPPQTMTDAIERIWGPGCGIHPNGVWDPPQALQTADQQVGVAWGPAKPGSMPSTHEATVTQTPGPASSTGLRGFVAATALAQNAEAGPNIPDTSAQSTSAPETSDSGSSGGSSPQEGGDGQSQNESPAQAQEGGDGQSQNESPAQAQEGGDGQSQNESPAQASEPAPKVVVIHSSTYTHVVQSGGVNVLVDPNTRITLPAPDQTQQAGNIGDSIAGGLGMSRSSGAVGGSETQSAPPTVVVISQQTYSVVPAANGAYKLLENGTIVDVQAITPTELQASTSFISSTGSSTPLAIKTATSSAATFHGSSWVVLSIAVVMQGLLYVGG